MALVDLSLPTVRHIRTALSDRRSDLISCLGSDPKANDKITEECEVLAAHVSECDSEEKSREGGEAWLWR